MGVDPTPGDQAQRKRSERLRRQQRQIPRRLRFLGRPPTRRLPTLEPISEEQRRIYDSRPHESVAEIRAKVIANAALKHIGPDIARSRRAAPGPAVSGYDLLATAIGPNLAARVPGTFTRSGQRPRSTTRGTLKDLFLLSPYMRGVRAPYRVAKAIKARKPPREIVQAARTPVPWAGPAYRTAIRAYLDADPATARDYGRMYSRATGKPVGDLSDPDVLARFTRDLDPRTSWLVLQQAIREEF